MDLDLNKNNEKFKDYFRTIINSRVDALIDELNEHHTTYLFSGILRNYFLNYYGQPRDLDIVVSRKYSHSNLKKILLHYGSYSINAFGGYKLDVNGLSIDIWHIEDTWAIKNNLVKVGIEPIEMAVLRSTFFNFSAILYNFKEQEFIYGESFKEFYKSKTIDIVLQDNLSVLLCLINIVYYAEEYKLSLSTTVKKYYIEHFKEYTKFDFDTIQLKHFKTIKYEYSLLSSFHINLKYNI